MFKTRTRQWIQSSLMVLLGLYFLDNLLTGQIFFYINERFGWLMWVAAALFLILGAAGIVELMRTRTQAAAQTDPTENFQYLNDRYKQKHDHAQGVVSWGVLGVLALPLIFGVFVPAKPLGASALGNSSINTGFGGSVGASTQLNIAPTDRNLLDWVRFFNGMTKVEEANGLPADVIGFVYRDIRFEGKPQFMVIRYIVACCVADANAIGVVVQSSDADKLQSDTWVRVTGKFTVQDVDGKQQPVLIPDKIEEVPMPNHPYLYP